MVATKAKAPTSESKRIVVYRYMAAEYALEALQTGEFKVGRINELNDPYDCQPNIFEDCLASPNLRGLPHDEYGVLSFSAAYDDPVVWSHYADSHRGIAIGFTFISNYHKIVKVKYSAARPQINRSELLEKHKGKDVLHDKVFAHKARSWSYEKEYRFLVPFSVCVMRGAHYFYRMPTSNLKSVILGERCKFTETDIKNLVKEFYPKPHISRCMKLDSTYYMGFTDKTFSL